MLLERHLGQPVHMGLEGRHVAGQRLVALPLRPHRAAGEFRRMIVGVSPPDRQHTHGVDIGGEMAWLTLHRLHAAFERLDDSEAIGPHFHSRHTRFSIAKRPRGRCRAGLVVDFRLACRMARLKRSRNLNRCAIRLLLW